jgi:hypothetical protein
VEKQKSGEDQALEINFLQTPNQFKKLALSL